MVVGLIIGAGLTIVHYKIPDCPNEKAILTQCEKPTYNECLGMFSDKLKPIGNNICVDAPPCPFFECVQVPCNCEIVECAECNTGELESKLKECRDTIQYEYLPALDACDELFNYNES